MGNNLEILAVVLGFLGVLFYNVQKRRSSEALLKTIDTKKLLVTKDEAISELEALKLAEEETRKIIIQRLEEEKGKKLTNEELSKFFNNL